MDELRSTQIPPVVAGARWRRLRGTLAALTAVVALGVTPVAALADDAGDLAAQPPATQTPVEPTPAEPTPDAGVTDPPPTVEEPPVEEPPVDPPPAEEPPVDPPPAEEPPVEEPPVEQPPVEQPPVEQPPVEQPPAEEPPVEQPPAEDPPAEEPPVEQPVERPARTPTQPKPQTPAPKPEAPAPKPTAPVAPAPAPDPEPAPAPVPDVTPAPAPAPVAVEPVQPAAPEADDDAEAARDTLAIRRARDEAAKRVVRTALARLGLTPTPTVVEQLAEAAAPASTELCAPIVATVPSVAIAAGAASGTVAAPAVHQDVRETRERTGPDTVRGPPAPADQEPLAPVAAGSSASAGSGAAAGTGFSAILVSSVSAQLAEAETVAPPCSFESNPATPTSNDSARAPPAA